MGLNTTLLVADSSLTDDQLAAIGLFPLAETARSEEMLLTSNSSRSCVVRSEGHTVIIGGVDALGALVQPREGDGGAGSEAVCSLPGVVQVASVVDSVGYADYCVVEDGIIVRRLTSEESAVTVDSGAPAIDESAFLLSDDSEDSDPDIDGEILVQRLPELAGCGPISVFSLVGDAYGSRSSATVRRGFFRRLFGS